MLRHSPVPSQPSLEMRAPEHRCTGAHEAPSRGGRVWAVVLAGGDGTRVAAFSRDARGEPVPKQYCSFGGGEPLVLLAIRRAAAVVSRSRIVVVVAEQHRRYWSELLAELPQENIIVQPRNKGTAAGILLPVLEVVLRRDRDARVLVLPADHYVGEEATLQRALCSAVRTARRSTAAVVLLGMLGEDGDHEYGWILPATSAPAGVRAVSSFVEKPDPETRQRLARAGALVNSFIFASRGRTLVQLYEDALPDLLRAFVPVVLSGRREEAMRELYDRIPSRDFSRRVLEPSARSLAVLAVPPCGWSDLGTPSRLQSHLGRQGLRASAPVAAAV